MATTKKNFAFVFFVLFIIQFGIYSTHAATSGVVAGDSVILIKPMNDGVTYYVKTPSGTEIWKDRDLYHFAGYQEKCKVIQSYGSEVLLYVPIMYAKYWFTVLKVGK